MAGKKSAPDKPVAGPFGRKKPAWMDRVGKPPDEQYEDIQKKAEERTKAWDALAKPRPPNR